LTLARLLVLVVSRTLVAALEIASVLTLTRLYEGWSSSRTRIGVLLIMGHLHRHPLHLRIGNKLLLLHELGLRRVHRLSIRAEYGLLAILRLRISTTAWDKFCGASVVSLHKDEFDGMKLETNFEKSWNGRQ